MFLKSKNTKNVKKSSILKCYKEYYDVKSIKNKKILKCKSKVLK